MAFCWRADDDPLKIVFGSSLSPHQLKKVARVGAFWPSFWMRAWRRYPQHIPNKKETHHYDFPIKTSFSYENVNCHEIFISEQILLKLECEVDEYLYFPCVCTKNIKANGKWVLEALNQRYCLHEIPSIFYICKVWLWYVVVMWDNQCVFDAFFVIQNSIFIS